MTTQVEWQTNTCQLVMSKVPSLDFQGATGLVSTYLVSAGGWVPDDQTDPLGNGAPANGATPEVASTSIQQAQFAMASWIVTQVSITVKIGMHGQFPVGTSASSMRGLLQTQAEQRLISSLEEYGGADVVSIDWTGSTTTDQVGGFITSTQRIAIQTALSSSAYLVDSSHIIVELARSIYGLDSTWNATSLFADPSGDFYAYVEKYQPGYSIVDTSSGYQIVIRIGSDQKLVSSIKLPYNS